METAKAPLFIEAAGALFFCRIQHGILISGPASAKTREGFIVELAEVFIVRLNLINILWRKWAIVCWYREVRCALKYRERFCLLGNYRD